MIAPIQLMLHLALAVLTLLAPDPTSGVITIYNRDSVGHACPISETQALTAEHVSSKSHVPVPLVYSTQAGTHGTAKEIDSDATRDLSLIEIVKGVNFAKFYPVAKVAPRPGDTVYILGFNFEKGLTQKAISARLLVVDGPFLTYDKTPGPGSSGSCIVTATGDVIGINTGYFDTERSPVGRGVAIWGPWRQFLESDYAPREEVTNEQGQ